jgi:hypothetical protein
VDLLPGLEQDTWTAEKPLEVRGEVYLKRVVLISGVCVWSSRSQMGHYY